MLLSAILGCQAPSALPPGGAIEPGWYTLPPLPHPLQEVAVLARDDGTAWVLGGFDDTIQVRQEIWILGTDRVWREGPAL
ncbi:MAG: hypothetical protein KC656_33845, partial [Myxococcales bacterium]|nr:hypothetical protein [Myxococcales bacterium]